MAAMRIFFPIILGGVLSLIGLEAIFQCLPVVSGLRLQSTTQELPFNRYLPRLPYTYSYGWALSNARRGVTNQQGFNNSPDFAAGARALVIGDSFVEALMLDYPQTIQGNLNRLSGGGVYAGAASGNGLADTLEIARFYIPLIQPKNLVIVVEEGNMLSLVEPPARGHSGIQELNGKVQLVHARYEESSNKQLVLKSALARYIYYNLKARDWLLTPEAHAVVQLPTKQQLTRRDRALAYYFQQLQRIAGQNTQVIFVVDGDRKAIYDPLHAKQIWRGDDRAAFIDRARSVGYRVVDLQPVFSQHWNVLHERLDFLPMDGHWNQVAHQLAAQQVLPLLQ
ncbi:hypothetical protein RugamoR64_54150 [Duganella rhizosphaerae]|uniref:alginate O-acetyltransferase AlgX-related protein n=1 Tax=Duganella rhizosphaerae TaxID=2885763 RepID=UPI0030E97B3E